MQDHPASHPRLIFCPDADQLRVNLRADTIRFECPMPRLAGPDHQCLATGSQIRPIENGALLDDRGGGLSGVLLAEPGLPLEEASENLFTRLFSLLDGRRIRRIWNFVPEINHRVDGRENYLAFNAGRHRAFNRWLGEIQPGALPAASALGITGPRLGLAFTAGADPVELFENPLQIPACRYPERYGKLPPLFARGSRVRRGADGLWHLSGTASIKGSDTIGSNLDTQIATTIENSRVVLEHMEVPVDLPGCWKVFLRRPEHLDAARAAFESAWPAAAAHCLYLKADICRADLLVEIEALFDPSCIPALAHI